MPASRLRRLLVGGSSGNEHLTLAVAALLLVLLAVEGATLLNLNWLLTVHAFVGMLLIPGRGAEGREHRLADGRLLPRAARSTSGAGHRTSRCAC